MSGKDEQKKFVFTIERRSQEDFTTETPHPEAKRGVYESESKTTQNVEGWWYADGKDHRQEGGMHYRTMGRIYWYVEFRSLKEFLAFITSIDDDENEVIVGFDYDDDNGIDYNIDIIDDD